jgi:hypothetical protein
MEAAGVEPPQDFNRVRATGLSTKKDASSSRLNAAPADGEIGKLLLIETTRRRPSGLLQAAETVPSKAPVWPIATAPRKRERSDAVETIDPAAHAHDVFTVLRSRAVAKLPTMPSCSLGA